MVFLPVGILVHTPWLRGPRSLARMVYQISLLGPRARWQYSKDLPVTLSMTELDSREVHLLERSRRLVAVANRGRVPSIPWYGLGPVSALAQTAIRWGHHCLAGEGRWRLDWSGYWGVTCR